MRGHSSLSRVRFFYIVRYLIEMFTISLENIDHCANSLAKLSQKREQDLRIGDISIRNDNGIVVEILDSNYFKIFKKRPLFTYTENSLSNFIALIQLSDAKAFVRIKIKRRVLIFTLIWYVLFLSLSTYLLLNEKFAGLIFIFLMLLAPVAFLRERIKFKKYIIKYIANV